MLLNLASKIMKSIFKTRKRIVVLSKVDIDFEYWFLLVKNKNIYQRISAFI